MHAGQLVAVALRATVRSIPPWEGTVARSATATTQASGCGKEPRSKLRGILGWPGQRSSPGHPKKTSRSKLRGIRPNKINLLRLHHQREIDESERPCFCIPAFSRIPAAGFHDFPGGIGVRTQFLPERCGEHDGARARLMQERNY